MALGKDIPILAQNDPWLAPYSGVILKRMKLAEKKEKELLNGSKTLEAFANGHLFFGLHRINLSWILREWAPNATEIFLIGDFSEWKPNNQFAFQKKENGVWEINLPKESLKHGDLYRLSVHWQNGQGDRIPAWATRVVQDPVTLIFNAQVWDPPNPYKWKVPKFINKNEFPLIYESHIGMATEEEKVGTYNEFRELVLPRIHKAGYNTIQLMAIQEHPYYGSFGYHVSSFFAPSSRFGSPDDLKALIDEAHKLGIVVIMDLVHSHSVKNEAEGLGKFDGTPYQYFHEGPRREHIAWDSLCFNYYKNEVLHFLLSNCKYWLEEFHFDGYRFDGVTSMLYLNHGLASNFTNYGMYFDGNEDEDAIAYCMLANKLIHQVNPKAITVAEEMSGMPGTASPIDWGGLGFDYRLSMGTPDYWIKIIKEIPDEQWNVGEIFHELTNRRNDEKTVGYAESHDQALVGDKTIIFRLIDKEMYYSMDKNIQNISVDRGIALHKMIRLITLSTSGNGYLNFMGNEFGHPEWIDFPRVGNNWSYFYARRQWNLADNPGLKYHYLADFDKEMIEMTLSYKLLNDPYCNYITGNMPDQVLAYERAGLIFVFNFNPFRSFTDYGIGAKPGKYSVVLSTDSKKFGGQELTDESMSHYTVSLGKPGFIESHMLKLYLPARTAFVFKSLQVKNVYDLIK